MQQAHTYQERSREYLSKAFQELEAGDLTQASEKGWGAAAQMVKAVAHDKGMEHHSHRSLLFAAQDYGNPVRIRRTTAQEFLRGYVGPGRCDHAAGTGRKFR
jgi:uncharacterized protein (UPF0332 family)